MITLILAAISGFIFGIVIAAMLGANGRAELEDKIIMQEMLIDALKSNIEEKEKLIRILAEENVRNN